MLHMLFLVNAAHGEAGVKARKPCLNVFTPCVPYSTQRVNNNIFIFQLMDISIYSTVISPRSTILSLLVPIITLKSPGSTTSFMSRLTTYSCSGPMLKVKW